MLAELTAAGVGLLFCCAVLYLLYEAIHYRYKVRANVLKFEHKNIQFNLRRKQGHNICCRISVFLAAIRSEDI